MFEDNPFAEFHACKTRALVNNEPWEAASAALATVGAEGPSVRYVLVKEFHEALGLIFFTHATSQKGIELAADPRAALAFHWLTIGVQIRASGAVSNISDEAADAYFHSRPRTSQLGAWASKQSEPLVSREALLEELAAVEKRFPDFVPRPAQWKGYALKPSRFECWREGEFRLHDRMLYELEGSTWTRTRLGP